MAVDPRRTLPPLLVHVLDQLSGRVAEVGPLIEAHRKRLIAEGTPPGDALALTHELEVRLLGRLLTEAEYRLSDL